MNLLKPYQKISLVIINNLFQQIDWTLFTFLLLLLNVKLWVKVMALLMIYSMRFNFRFELKRKGSGLPLFYVIVMMIALFNWLVYSLYSHSQYGFVLLTGLSFWVYCVLAIHQLKRSVENRVTAIIHNTLVLFFILNIIVSFSNLLLIVMETGALNPYQYQGLYQKYFIGTGDYIRGLSFDTSTTNALINAFGVLFFLSRKKIMLTLCCMAALLLTCSNLTNLLLAIALGFFFIFQSDRDQKSMIIVCFLLLAVFLGRVSPQNNHYFFSAVKTILNIPGEEAAPVPAALNKPEEGFSPEEEKIRHATAYLDSVKQSWTTVNQPKTSATNSWVKPFIPQPDINAKQYQSAMDTTALQKSLLAFSHIHYPDSTVFLKRMRTTKTAGKIIAMQETLQFLKHNPGRIITGDGMGNFSSKLAFRVSALGIGGKYPESRAYIHPDFLYNHLRLYLYYFSKHKDVHSIIHTPHSVFNQLLGEYGSAGLISFLIFYLGWFTITIRKTSYSAPLLIIMTGAFFTGYWFEQLSVVPFFELLMLLDKKCNGEISLPYK